MRHTEALVLILAWVEKRLIKPSVDIPLNVKKTFFYQNEKNKIKIIDYEHRKIGNAILNTPLTIIFILKN